MGICKDIHILHVASSEKPAPTAASKPVHQKDSSQSMFLPKLADPPINPNFKPVDYVSTLAEIHKELGVATSNQEKSRLYLEQSFVFRGLGELKLLRRSLRLARQHATTNHHKLVIAAWLKFERRGEELDENPGESASHRAAATSTRLADHIPCLALDYCDEDEQQQQQQQHERWHFSDVVFHVEGDRIYCNRQKMAALSLPFDAMLNGCFTESRRTNIEFSRNGISAMGMRAVDKFARTGTIGRPSPTVVIEVMTFANKFFCDKLKEACDQRLATCVHTLQDAITFLDCALDENAQSLVGACLQVFLRELPKSLYIAPVSKLFSTQDGRKRLSAVGHSSFSLYCLLGQAAMDDDFSSDMTVKLLHFAKDCAVSSRQRALALHQLGCSMLARKQYKEAHEFFEAAADEGHIYSLAGVARVKYMRGHRMAAYSEAASIIACYKNSGWMFEEKSLYCLGHDKLSDLNTATELDPTLTYPYKYRAAVLMDEKKVHEAITEISRVLRFCITKDCLELRVYFSLALLDYEAAVRDLRALLTFDPGYRMYSGRVCASQLLDLLKQHVVQWTKADCWMKLYDHWSSVDDISSLAVVHQMLETEAESSKGLLFFRQSLLLLRLSCPKAALRSLRLAREHADNNQEKLVYEGWLLYDTGHRQEALRKAEESISLQRSFEAFFLKAYALADTSLDPTASTKVIGLLEEALKCPSDGLRKGQALNNLGSVYVDCGKLEQALDCYVNALKIRHTRAHQGLARVYFLQGDRKSAFDEMTKLIEKSMNNASAYEKRAEYCDRDLVMADLSMVTQIDPLRTYPYRYRAAVAMDSQRDREAIAELSKAIAFKADLQLLHLRAAFHECSGEISDALRDCRAALSIDPTHSDTLELYGRVQHLS
ncbi:ethylene-overproduction protein 1 [Selaginella moellendorffii]|nr:ethylene-overproduction protein 1 [Selaginella moellendorffii]|eukprot:XP_024520512.1 ethylene-overproduction protein 1 [Selaginella moellendorffii]